MKVAHPIHHDICLMLVGETESKACTVISKTTGFKSHHICNSSDSVMRSLSLTIIWNLYHDTCKFYFIWYLWETGVLRSNQAKQFLTDKLLLSHFPANHFDVGWYSVALACCTIISNTMDLIFGLERIHMSLVFQKRLLPWSKFIYGYSKFTKVQRPWVINSRLQLQKMAVGLVSFFHEGRSNTVKSILKHQASIWIT